MIGCLGILPSIFLAARMSFLVREFVYVVIYAGIHPAVTHEVTLMRPEGGPLLLSNGELLHNHVWTALLIFVQFPLITAGVLGLTYFAELMGRFVELRRHSRSNDHSSLPRRMILN